MKVFLEQESRKFNFEYRVFDEKRNIIIDRIRANRIILFFSLRRIEIYGNDGKYVLKQENRVKKILSLFLFHWIQCPYFIYRNSKKIGIINRKIRSTMPFLEMKMNGTTFVLNRYNWNKVDGNRSIILLDGKEIAEVIRDSISIDNADHYILTIKNKEYFYEICCLVMVLDVTVCPDDLSFRGKRQTYTYSLFHK